MWSIIEEYQLERTGPDTYRLSLGDRFEEDSAAGVVGWLSAIGVEEVPEALCEPGVSEDGTYWWNAHGEFHATTEGSR